MKLSIIIYDKALRTSEATGDKTAHLDVTGSADAINRLIELLKQVFTWT